MNRLNLIAALKPTLFILGLAPLAYYAIGFFADRLGANPIEALTRGLGTWALNFLLISLAVTPLRKLSGWNLVIRWRRMLGLYCFFYASLHLGAYLWLDQFFDGEAIVRDILKRPFITVGMVAFMLLLPLALSSNTFSLRKLGGKRWQALHRSVYAIGPLAILHYAWMVKADLGKPSIYAALLAVLLGLRLLWFIQPRLARNAPTRKTSPSPSRTLL